MKNEFTITKERMLSWAKPFPIYGTVNIIRFILWTVIGLVGAAMTVLLSLTEGKPHFWVFAILFVLLAVYKLFFEKYVMQLKRYKYFSKLYGVTEWSTSIVFGEREITLTEHTSVMTFRYDAITKIKEGKDAALVFFDCGTAVRVFKNAFTEGSWEECLAKIAQMRR